MINNNNNFVVYLFVYNLLTMFIVTLIRNLQQALVSTEVIDAVLNSCRKINNNKKN